jgi:hypothetical protein
MGPLLPLIVAAAAGIGGWEYWKHKTPAARYVGDLAKAGDTVEVSVPDLIKANASISLGAAAGQIPSGTLTVLVLVQGASKDTLQGPLTAFGTAALPSPLGSVVVNRADVTKVMRGGKTATAATLKGSTQFNGERRFLG